MAAAWMVLASLANAGAPPAAVAYELRWVRGTGAESCIEARELAVAVSARLGRPAFDGAGARVVSIDGEVRATDTGWRVALTIRDPADSASGDRELTVEGVDCHAIDEPLALVLAMIIDPEAGLDAPPIAMPAMSPVGWRADARVTGAAAVGAMPGAGLAARAALAIDAPSSWPIAVSGSWWASGTESLEQGRSATVRRWQVGLALCTPARGRGRVKVDGCGGAAVARLRVRGVGFAEDRTTAATVPLVTATARVAIDLSPRWFVAGEGGVEVPLTRPRFVDGAGVTVHDPSPAAVSAAIGLGVRI